MKKNGSVSTCLMFQQTCCSRIARIGVAQLGSDPGSGRYGTPAFASRNEKENDFSCLEGHGNLTIGLFSVPKIQNWKQNETNVCLKIRDPPNFADLLRNILETNGFETPNFSSLRLDSEPLPEIWAASWPKSHQPNGEWTMKISGHH